MGRGLLSNPRHIGRLKTNLLSASLVLFLTDGSGLCWPADDFTRLSAFPTPEEAKRQAQEWATGRKLPVGRLRFVPAESLTAWWGEEANFAYRDEGADGICVKLYPRLQQSYRWSRLGTTSDADSEALRSLIERVASLAQLESSQLQVAQERWLAGVGAPNWGGLVPVGGLPMSLYQEVLPGDVVTGTRYVIRLDPRDQGPRLYREIIYTERPQLSNLVGLAQAMRGAARLCEPLVGQGLVSIAPHQSVATDAPATGLHFQEDDLGRKRLTYWLSCDYVEGPGETALARADRGMAQASSHISSLLVKLDAASGALAGFVSALHRNPQEMASWGRLSVDGKPQDLNYPLRVHQGAHFLWWGYLDSRLWAATLTEEETTWAAKVDGVTWTVERDTFTVRREGVREDSDTLPCELDGLLYLPIALVSRITGWETEADVGERSINVKLPVDLKQRLDAIAALGKGLP
jgi:hypothetical protein